MLFFRAQAVLGLQLLKEIGLGELGDLTRLLGFIDLDAQGLDLLLKALLPGRDLLGHPLEDPGELP